MGGLGNQLFQIFATISYAIKHKERFNFLYSEMLGSRVTYWNTFLINLKSFTHLNLSNVKIIKEQVFHYQDILSPNLIENNGVMQKENIKLYGYFQSYKYFQDYYDTISKLIKLEKQKERVIYKYIQNYKSMVSMHFRLGDYKLLQEFHPIMKIEYYKNSIEHIVEKTNNKNLKILYFSEKKDATLVDETINNLKNLFPDCIFIKAFDYAEDWEQMLMMSLCSHNIIANSTFSWWSAYFNSNKDKIVCYPAVWFGPRLIDVNNTRDLFPDGWIKINSM
jgi:hypothetical protein